MGGVLARADQWKAFERLFANIQKRYDGPARPNDPHPAPLQTQNISTGGMRFAKREIRRRF
jgi:hypothetical protein